MRFHAKGPDIPDELLAARGDFPDETYMIATCMEPWQQWPVLVDGRSYHQLADSGLAGNTPVDDKTLEWITGKRG